MDVPPGGVLVEGTAVGEDGSAPMAHWELYYVGCDAQGTLHLQAREIPGREDGPSVQDLVYSLPGRDRFDVCAFPQYGIDKEAVTVQLRVKWDFPKQSIRARLVGVLPHKRAQYGDS